MRHMLPLAFLLGFAAAGLGQEPDVSECLAKLRSHDMNERAEGLYGLQFSLDPRIPEGVLPLLTDEGGSIRVYAARVIGSRWWQIPGKQIAKFTKALEPNARVEGDLRESSMGLRGIGLLNRDYSSGSFSRSPDKRWVIYERFSCPCLIDTRNATEELIGYGLCVAGEVGRFLPTWNDRTVKESTLWHRNSEMAAFAIKEDRVTTGVLVWMHKKGTKHLDLGKVEDFMHRNGCIAGAGMANVFPIKWRGKSLELEVGFHIDPSPDYDSGGSISWDPENDRMTLLSVNKTKPE